MARLDHRVAIVTGAGSGIGAAIALRLGAEGAAVAAVDLDGARAEALAESLEADGCRAIALAADVSTSRDRDRLVAETVRALGPIDVLVNNAATTGPRVPFLSLTEEQWTEVMATNLAAPAFLARAVVPSMAERRTGSIVNLGAIQEYLPTPTYAAYAASKGGISALTRALAVEFSPAGIRVNAVQPGAIDTGSARLALSQAATTPTGSSVAPTLLGRLGQPSEVAAAVAFLASDEASFVTGEIIRIDGGRMLSRAPDPLSGFAALTDPSAPPSAT